MCILYDEYSTFLNNVLEAQNFDKNIGRKLYFKYDKNYTVGDPTRSLP